MERHEMYESEDSDIEDEQELIRHKTKIIYHDRFPYVHMETPDILYERWGKISPKLRREAGHLLHISVFWWHILYRQQDSHSTTAWAMDMGFLDPNVSNDLSLKRLHRIEILELVLDTVEKCLASTDPERKAKELIMISMSFRMEDDGLSYAVSWLNEFGPPGLSRKILQLGSKQIRHQVLDFVFSEYSRYIQVMSCSKKKMFRELRSLDPEPWSLQKSEEMKNKGNEQFQKKKYELAVKWYTKAIKNHANNHILYGNRALCYIRCEKYLKAMGDGKRAILLQRDWAKGHYRFCDALFFLGARDKAIEANATAQNYCTADPEGMRDLQQQYIRFMTEISEGKTEGKQTKTEAKKGSSKRLDGACEVDPMAQHVPSDKTPDAAHSSNTAENKHKAEDTKQEEPSGKPVTDPQAEDIFKDAKSEMGDRKAKKAESGIPEKQSARNKQPPTQEKPQSSSSEEGSKKQFCVAVRDAHIALNDQRCRNAEQSFSEALRILGSTGTKDLSISELDRALLIYGYSTALIEIGQPEELAEALQQLKKLSSSANRTFQSLVRFGLGKVLLKENKFRKAKDEFFNALLMVERQIMPGKLTWPTTKVTVQETCPEYLREQLERFIEICKFPPKPDAICRHCLGQEFIYFTDPDFKGFIRLSCCQNCNVEYHINCWKKFKAASFSDKNDKDFLQDLCFTPDCTGTICRIIVFDSTGLIKCEFKSPISKSTVPGVRVKQKCTSLRKLESKEERKLRRKQQRMTTLETKNEMNNLNIEDKPEKGADKGIDQSFIKDCVYFGDRVLYQIDKHRDLFNDESHSISSMLVCLRPWMKLDEDKGHVSVLKDRTEPQVLRELVDLLLERKNRVWARLFLHNLSGCQDVKPKVHEWAQQLNNAGLKAAEHFIGQFGDDLEKLDLSFLMEFPPLHDVFLNKGFTVIEYLRQAPPQEMRLFIWILEEHREHYPSWFTLLDDYFEMDSICLVLKKTEKDDRSSSVYKSKNKNRKKKQKEPKSVLHLSEIKRDEEDDYFFEENSLMLLHDPFSVPDYLREQVAEFERQYVNPGSLDCYGRVVDNDPDQTKESLYDYFAQILEEHGPLEVSDPLLVGELKNFPPEAWQKIEAAGGLEHFLLESLRFVMCDDTIELMSHTMDDSSLLASISCIDDLEPKGSSQLNPTAKEFLPQLNHLSLDDSSESYDQAAIRTALPNPYGFVHLNLNDAFGQQDVPGTVKPDVLDLNVFLNSQLNAFKTEALGTDNNYNNFKEDIGPKIRTNFVQTLWGNKDTRDDVAINTEPYAQFEKNRGDMTQTEKNNIQFEKRIQNMREKLKTLQNGRRESCSVLDAELREISQHIEVSNKELTLFQQKLEEEVRKDQQEKRDHQEMLKVLKTNIKELVDFQDRILKIIQDKNMEYHKELEHYIAITTQFEAEKTGLEDKIKKYEDLCAKATSRSLAGQVSILKNRQEHGLRCLRKYLSDGNAILKHLTEMSPTYPSTGISSIIEVWKSSVHEVEEKIVTTEMKYEEQIELVKKGTRLSSLPAVDIPSVPAPPLVPAFLHPLSNQQPVLQQLSVQHAHPHTPYGVQQHPARHQTHMAENTHHAMFTPPAISENVAAPAPPAASGPAHPPQPFAVFERIVDRLSSMFPHYSRSVLTKFIQEVRSMNGGSLSMLKYEEVINRAAQLILDHQEHSQEQINFASGDAAGARYLAVSSPTPSTDSSRASATPPPAHVWKSVSSQHRKSSRALNMEDPCIICHDDMLPEDLCVLECRHSFHRECIKSWLKEQSTCPTCREHALLPEDFPMLPGRHRRGHMRATTFPLN